MRVLYRYVPILKARPIEWAAVATASTHTQSQMTPFLEIMDFPSSLLNLGTAFDPELPPTRRRKTHLQTAQ